MPSLEKSMQNVTFSTWKQPIFNVWGCSYLKKKEEKKRLTECANNRHYLKVEIIKPTKEWVVNAKVGIMYLT